MYTELILIMHGLIGLKQVIELTETTTISYYTTAHYS